MTIKWFQKSKDLGPDTTTRSQAVIDMTNETEPRTRRRASTGDDLMPSAQVYYNTQTHEQHHHQQQQQEQQQQQQRPSLFARFSLAKSQSCVQEDRHHRRDVAPSPSQIRINKNKKSPPRPPRSPADHVSMPMTPERPATTKKRGSPKKEFHVPSPVSSSSSSASSLSPDPIPLMTQSARTPVSHDQVHEDEDDDPAASENRRGRRNSLFENIRFSWLTSMSGRSSLIEGVPDNQNGAPKEAEHAEEVQIPQQAAEMGVIMQGWLEKCGQQFKTWNWRFFVLRDDGVLSYYADEQMKKLKGSIHVGYGSQANVSIQANLADKKNVFMIATPQRKTMITAPNRKIMSKWIARLQAIGATPSAPWDPLRKTVNYFVRDNECPHEWKRYDDPTSYIHMEGCLTKRGHIKKNWKNRFFRIEKGELRYYTENQEELKGSMPLKDTVVSPGMAQCPDGRKYYFVLTSKDGKVELHLNAHNEQDMHKWIEALQEAQIALRERGTNTTQTGLALVIKRAEEFPLAKFSVEYKSPNQVEVEMEKRTEALIVTSSGPKEVIPKGSQLIAVGGKSTLRCSYAEARLMLRASRFPLQMDFLLPPTKIGLLVKKSRTGFENWKKRVVMVTNGEIRYFKQLDANSMQLSSLKHRKSFSLYGCYVNLTEVPNRAHCIVVARSPSDKLVLQTPSEEERIDWASVIYCSIRMASQGITSGHIENLQLESAIEDSSSNHQKKIKGDNNTPPTQEVRSNQIDTELHGSFNSDCTIDF